MKLIPVNYFGFTAMDRRFSSPMLPWIVSEIRKRDYSEKLSLGIEDGVLQAYNQDFELQFSHKIWQVTRFSQADQDPTTFLYLMRDDNDTLLYCYLFQAKKSTDYQWKTIYDRVHSEPEFSGYRTTMKGNPSITLNLLYDGVTVLVPENQAIESYDGFFTDDLVLYHMGTKPYTLKELAVKNTIESIHEDNPPLWITVVPDGYYINNAKIIEKRSNYVAKCKRNQNLKQVLHVIDRVLDPMLLTPFTNPTAFDFLENYQNWKLGNRKVSNFFRRVLFHKKESLFKKPGGHTFFVPINDKNHDHRLADIDSYVIEGHVVPNMVLFTRPSSKNFTYETAANGDYIYIVVTLEVLNGKDYVKSHTILGDSEHRKGQILAEIVKGNIPVSNGVIHLISQPLAVFHRELKPFPYLPVSYKIAADPELNLTYHVGQKGRVNKIIRREHGTYTFFAPRNKAWDNYLGYTHEEMADILTRHLVVSDSRYTMSKLVTSSKGTLGGSFTVLETLGGSFNVTVIYKSGNFYINWGQKQVRVVRPDYECTDGVVHIVDDVFAAPKPPPSAPQPPKYSFWRSLKNLVT